jgi:hypothetical protein
MTNNALSDLGVVEGATSLTFNLGLITAGVLAFVFAVFGVYSYLGNGLWANWVLRFLPRLQLRWSASAFSMSTFPDALSGFGCVFCVSADRLFHSNLCFLVGWTP